jgi:hypothetical protein
MAGSPLTGGCLCGAVRFELDEPPWAASYCHCTRCQGRTGSAASAQAVVDGNAFRLTAGADVVRGWEPEGGFVKSFCPECGAHLFSVDPGDPSRMSVRMSAFDSDPGVRPAWRAWTAYAAAWEPIPDDGLPRYEERPPRSLMERPE